MTPSSDPNTAIAAGLSETELVSIMPALKSSLHRHLGTLGPDAHAELCRRLAIAFGCD